MLKVSIWRPAVDIAVFIVPQWLWKHSSSALQIALETVQGNISSSRSCKAVPLLCFGILNHKPFLFSIQ